MHDQDPIESLVDEAAKLLDELPSVLPTHDLDSFVSRKLSPVMSKLVIVVRNLRDREQDTRELLGRKGTTLDDVRRCLGLDHP